MARIHHATAAKAEKAGIELEVNHDLNVVVAKWGEYEYPHAEAKIALEATMLDRTFRLEYPALRLQMTEEGTFLVVHTDEAGEETTIWEDTELPTLAFVLEFCENNELDPEIGFDEAEEEEKKARVVVADHYKKEYAARGNPNNCGDWLALTLEEQCKTKEGIDIARFTDILNLNGVPMVGKWAELPTSGQRGWQGRYRMNGRQKLEVIVATRGTLFLAEDYKVAADRDWLEAMLAKHPAINPEWGDDEA